MAIIRIQNPLTITVDTDTRVNAIFVPVSPTPSPTSVPNISPTPTPTPSTSPTTCLALGTICDTRENKCCVGACISDPALGTFGGVCGFPEEEQTWRSCVDGLLRSGNPPPYYSLSADGTCWGPSIDVVFTPDLQTALRFTYQRGSAELPNPVTVLATNTSNVSTYSVSLTTNNNITITPSSFILTPNQSLAFNVATTPTILDQLGDGTSTFRLVIDIQQQV